jgi:hypothetical protein
MRGKLDDYKPMEVLRAFHDLVFATTGQDLTAMSRQNTWHQVGVLFILNRIGDAGACKPISSHVNLSKHPN